MENKYCFLFNAEQEQFIRNHAKGLYAYELADLLNKEFGTSFTTQQVSSFKKRKHIVSGMSTQFKKGHVPFNKGTKGFVKPNSGTFKKGQKPFNYRPIGSERVTVDGYTEIKVADPNVWKLKHRLIWEQHNGQIPKGSTVLFGDGDQSNFSIDNLLLATRAQLAMLNKNNLIQEDTELTKTAINVVDLMQKINQVKRKKI